MGEESIGLGIAVFHFLTFIVYLDVFDIITSDVW